MLSLDSLMIFMVTTVVVVLSPGPAVIAVTTEAASNGFHRAVWVILGIAVANVIFFILSATGIAALLLSSHFIFLVVKWVGVTYLLYLGIKVMFSPSASLALSGQKRKNAHGHKMFLRGFVLEIANPKALLYFSALLPQFIDTKSAIVPQMVAFCLITFILDLACYSLYAYAGSRTRVLSASPTAIKVVNRISGGMLMVVGVRMATLER